jgi:hypothetical protein
MQRVALALTFIKGERVERWVFNYSKHLAGCIYGINGRPPNYAPTDERLWDEFVVAFRRQFRDTAEAERAWTKLQMIAMKDNEIDDYIAEFENLIQMAGRSRNDPGSLDYFRQGLKSWLHQALLRRRPVPLTIDQWQAMAREEVEVRALTAASLGNKPKGWLVSRDSLAQSQSSQRSTDTQKTTKKRDPNAMDVDVVRTSRTSSLTKEQRIKLMKEGKCFICQKDGHMARACPDKRDKGKGKAPAAKVRTTTVVDDRDEKDKIPTTSTKEKEESPPDYDNEDQLRAAVRRMTTEDREAFMERLAMEDF